jgi:hypothetical protein
MSSDYPEREYGYGKPPKPIGAPVAVEAEGLPPCPHCGCVRTFSLTVKLEAGPPQLRVPEGCVPVGTYIGCPACPFASPMISTAVKEKS